MSFFLDDEEYAYIQNSEFVKSWQRFVLPLTNEKAKMQQRVDRAKNLWNQFNHRFSAEKKIHLEKYYMDDFYLEYLAFFFIPNIERIYSILQKKENLPLFYDLEKKIMQSAELSEISILDFGSGPLTASFAFIFAFQKFLKSKNVQIPKIKIFAVDRSHKIFSIGEKILSSCSQNISLEYDVSIAKQNGIFDVVLCGNALNEIPEKHQIKTLELLFSRVAQNGSLCIVEPGHSEISRQLSRARDHLVSHASPIFILSPCPHEHSCPFSKKENLKNWCWFKHVWSAPDFYLPYQKALGLDHYSLNYCYFIFHKTETPSKLKIQGRIVSDAIPLPNQPEECKFLLCHESGNIETLLEPVELLEHKKDKFYRGYVVYDSHENHDPEFQ
jgi:hypothetical protein